MFLSCFQSPTLGMESNILFCLKQSFHLVKLHVLSEIAAVISDRQSYKVAHTCPKLERVTKKRRYFLPSTFTFCGRGQNQLN